MQITRQITRLSRLLGVLLNIASGIALITLMIITCIDVFGRYLLNNPLTGSTELIEIGLGFLVFTALPVMSWRNENILVDIFDKYFPPLLHFIRGILIHSIFAVTLYFVGTRLIALGRRSLDYGETSEFLHIPLGWSIQLMGYMCLLTTMTLVSFGICNLWIQYKGSLD